MTTDYRKGLPVLAASMLGMFLVWMLTFPSLCQAAHPLSTDDAGTLGKGVFQVEVGGEISRHTVEEDGVKTRDDCRNLSPSLSYGIADTVDLIVGYPYVWLKSEEDGATISKEDGFSDLSLAVKWRFLEKNGFNLALKPGVTLPTGNEDKGLGSGRETYNIVFIATKDIEPFAFHFNAGYTRNENKLDERKDLWAASLAGEFKLGEAIKLVGETGLSRNADPSSETNPAFAAAGIIYALTEKLDIDIGYKAGLNKAETDHTFLAGITVKF